MLLFLPKRLSMFDFKQRVFTITALMLLIAGLVTITQQKDLESVLTTSPPLSVQTLTGYAVADTISGAAASDVSVSWSQAGQFLAYVFILSVLVVGVFQLAAFSTRLDENDDARQAVIAYIKQAREQGFSHGQIQKRLKAGGWDDQNLEKSLERVL